MGVFTSVNYPFLDWQLLFLRKRAKARGTMFLLNFREAFRNRIEKRQKAIIVKLPGKILTKALAVQTTT